LTTAPNNKTPESNILALKLEKKEVDILTIRWG
jgi:hypothetical protein